MVAFYHEAFGVAGSVAVSGVTGLDASGDDRALPAWLRQSHAGLSLARQEKPDEIRREGPELHGRLQKLGILRESGYEHFMGSVVLPVMSPEGSVMEIYQRKINENPRTGTPMHRHLRGPHRGVWNEEALVASKEIVPRESMIDALTFWCVGHRHVTATDGVQGFTEDHRPPFTGHGVKNVWIAHDRDEAGG